MKKIKRKRSTQHHKTHPAFVIGYSNHEPLPGGFLAEWFNRTFETPLDITFPADTGTTAFDASNHDSQAGIETQCSPDIARSWRDRLEWIHTQVAEIYAPKASRPHGQDQVLHLARLARGMAELTDGTAYDVGTATYVNPSDWITQPMDHFRLIDHVRVEQVERPDTGRVWFHTRGLGKFGFDEIETYKDTGLATQPVIDALANIAESVILRGHPLHNGESFEIRATGQIAQIVRYRTDPTYGPQLNLREVVWT